jgi:hypothetical protein
MPAHRRRAMLGLWCTMVVSVVAMHAALAAPVDTIFFINDTALPAEAYAVGRLQHWLAQACGGRRPAVVSGEPAAGRWLAVGHLAAVASGLAPPLALAPPLGDEGYTIRCSPASGDGTAGGNAAGGNGAAGATGCAVAGAAEGLRGTMYGVYELLERWGFRFFAWDTIQVPAACPAQLLEAAHNLTVRPGFTYRDASDVYAEGARPTCAANPRCDHKDCSKLCDSEHVAASRSQWEGAQDNATIGWNTNHPYTGLPGFCHTSLRFASPGSWNCNASGCCGPRCAFADPRENGTLFQVRNAWFWPHNGTAAGVTSLCWAADGLAEHIIGTVRGWMRKYPKFGANETYMSLTQEDTSSVCADEHELAAVAAEGGAYSGPMLRVVNAVARNISEDLPHLLINTLAYGPTTQPPRTVRPAPNVAVTLTTMDDGWAVPLTDKRYAPTNYSHGNFTEYLQTWAGISKTLWIWDYDTDFEVFVAPWPNYFSLGPNMQLYARNGVTGLFAEGGGNLAEDMGAMKQYMLAKMMWNTSLAAEWEGLMSEFLHGYYGAAAAHMRAYMEAMHAASVRTGDPVKMFETSDRRLVNKTAMKYLTPAALLQAGAALQAAKTATAQDKPLFRGHVELAELPTLYCVLPRWDEIRAYAAQKSVTWPFLQTKDVQLAKFVQVFNATGDTNTDIRHTIVQYEAFVKST